jgi:hypothetical protein
MKKKTPILGKALNLESGPSSAYYVCSIQACFSAKRNLDWAKTRKTKLGPSFELGARPKLGLFFVQSKFLSMLRNILIKHK